MRARRYMADQYEGNAEPDLELYAHYGHTIYAHKATEGVGHVDSRHKARAREAHRLGLTVVHYHFARPDEGQALWEARNFRGSLEVGVFQPGDYLAIDLERQALNMWAPTYSYLVELYDAIVRETRHDPLIYANTDFLTNLGGGGWLGKRRIWQADYNLNRGKLPWRTPVWACQFTDGEQGARPHALAGIGECDVSLLRLDVALVLDARFRWRRRRVKHH